MEIKLSGFNRPKAISCLATLPRARGGRRVPGVSIARRRLVVLRRVGHCSPGGRELSFQSPEGD